MKIRRSVFKYIIIPFLLLALSCNKNDIQQELQLAEENMMEDPQTTLEKLEIIDTTQIESSHDKAFYALLLTQARDKNYRFETNDSLISKAVEYYDKCFFKDDNKRMLAHFYKGILNFNAKNYSDALSELSMALSLVKKDDYFYKGKIHDAMADIYVRSYNIPTAAEHRKKAVYYYKRADKKLFDFYCIDDLSKNLMNIDSLEQANKLMDSLLTLKDSDLQSHMPLPRMSKVYYYLNKKDFKKALYYYMASKLYHDTYFIRPHYAPIAYMFAANNLPDSTYKYLSLEENNNPEYIRNSWYNKARYELARQSGDYKEMYDKYVFKDSIADILLKEALDRNVALREAEFYYSKNELAEKSKAKWIYISITTASICAILLLLLLNYLQKVKFHQLETEQRLREFLDEKYLSEDNSIIPTDEKEISPQVSKTIVDAQQESKKNDNNINYNIDIEGWRNLLKEVLANELDPVKSIAIQYFSKETDEQKKRELSINLGKIIEKINSEREATIIEKLVDSINDGVIAEIKKEVPNLNARDIRYLIFEMSGCTTNMIALLLNKKPSHCRIIKKRLIEKINESGSERAIQLLQQLVNK